LRQKIPELQVALEANIPKLHRFQLGRLMAQLRFLKEEIAAFDRRIQEQTAEDHQTKQRWDQQVREQSLHAIGAVTEEHLKAWATEYDARLAASAKRCAASWLARYEIFATTLAGNDRTSRESLRPHRALKFGRVRTPVMQAGLTSKQTTFSDVFTSNPTSLRLAKAVFVFI
jgi:hypothetical protein